MLDYLLVFLPFVALWTCMAVGTMVDWQPSPITLLIATIGCLLVGVGASISLFYWLKVRGSSDTHAEAAGARSLWFGLLGLTESLITLATVMFFLALTSAVSQAEHARLFGMLVLVAILVAHVSANVSRFEPATTVAVWMVVLFMVVSVPFGAPMYGALSLRMLGIGGGVGKEITLHTFDVRSGNPIVKTVKGCLLIKTGDEIAIHPTSTPSECLLTHLLPTSSSSRGGWEVDVYPASMLIESKTLMPLADETSGTAQRERHENQQ